MPSVVTPFPQSAEPASEDADLVRLRARWLERSDPETTRRDEVLRALRAGAGSASGERPTDLRGISLIEEDLSGADLSGCDLSAADLSGADLSNARLAACRLAGATLFRAKLVGAELLGADLEGAHLNECIAKRAGFGHANLARTDFFHADLECATLSGAVLAGADLRAANLEGARLREADLSGANLSRSRLSKADLGKSTVHGADFRNADLREARIRGIERYETAAWVGVDLRDIDFSGAYVLRRHIMDENYLFEFRSRTRWSRFVYQVWWLTSNCGRSLARWLAFNLLLALVFGVLYRNVELDYGAYRTEWSPYYFSFVTLTTLGYGDVVPACATAQLLATLEVLLGYLGLGGLLSILANKMARRAE